MSFLRRTVKLIRPQFALRSSLTEDSEIEQVKELSSTFKRNIQIIRGYYVTDNSEKQLFTKYPYLKLYWDFERNRGINPRILTGACELFVWWTCRLNHNVRMKVKSRAKFVDCNVCARMTTPIPGSLLERHPDVAKEWDYQKNYPLIPVAVHPCARERAWWICPEKGHSYLASPDNRIGKGSGCGRCARSKIALARHQKLRELGIKGGFGFK